MNKELHVTHTQTHDRQPDDYPGSFSIPDYAISRIDQVNAVIATTKHALSALVPSLRNLVGVDHTHTQPITAAIFVLDSVERELDEVSLFLSPIGEAQEAARKMIAATKKK